MKKSDNLGLNLPEDDDFFDVEHQNENMRKLDERIKEGPVVDGKTVFKNENGALYIKPGSTIKLKEVSEISIKNGIEKVTISWSDPEDAVISSAILATWESTKLVMNEEHYPQDENDGTVIVENVERNKYKKNGYIVKGLTNGKIYYFKLFPCSTDKIYTNSSKNQIEGHPGKLPTNPCSDVTVSATEGQAIIKWTDPDATKIDDGETITWQKTVLVYKQGTEAPVSINDGTIAIEETERNKYQHTGYTVTGLTNGNDYAFSLFAVSTFNTESEAATCIANMYAVVTVTTEETSLYNRQVTASKGSNIVNAIFDASGIANIKVPWIGNTKIISSNDDGDKVEKTINVTTFGASISIKLSLIDIVTFADGTDEQIAAMINAHYNNKINIADYWSVGDKRKVNLSAMAATGVSESHRAQTVEFAIADFEHDDLTAAINGHTKAAVTLTQVDCLMDATSANNDNNGSNDTEIGYMNSDNTNASFWVSCLRRKWCNEVYYNALPDVLRSMVKKVNKLGSEGNVSTKINTVSDYIFLLAEVEVTGSADKSVVGEGRQYTYYRTTVNRYKLPKYESKYSSQVWWLRSPVSFASVSYCAILNNGNVTNGANNARCGIAPCLCI